MFAKNLERELYELCGGSDFSNLEPADIAERFESLRKYRRLPPGREHRAKHLSSTEIAHAIFGLVPRKPGWAGHAAIVLSDLRVAGGRRAAFAGVSTLRDAVEVLLSNDAARDSLCALMTSAAASGINVNGFAQLTYDDGGTRRCAFFVSRMALSLLQVGGETQIDRDSYHAPVSHCLVFDRAFFEKLTARIKRSEAMPVEVAGDGSEYDATEAQQARYRALGVTPQSRYLSIPVDTQVTWPKQEQLIRFDGYQLVLLPKTKDSTQSVHIDLYVNRLDPTQAQTIVNRLLSVLAWCDDQFAVAQEGWSGSPVPTPMPKRDLAFATAHEWTFDRRIPDSDPIRRALAHYREGCNAEEASLAGYAVLSFFKTIEIKYPDAEEVKRWIKRQFSDVELEARRDPAFARFVEELQGTPPEEYLNRACRVAVAHASKHHPSDADDATESRRLYIAAHVLRLFARHFVSHELGVSKITFSGD